MRRRTREDKVATSAVGTNNRCEDEIHGFGGHQLVGAHASRFRVNSWHAVKMAGERSQYHVREGSGSGTIPTRHPLLSMTRETHALMSYWVSIILESPGLHRCYEPALNELVPQLEARGVTGSTSIDLLKVVFAHVRLVRLLYAHILGHCPCSPLRDFCSHC